MGSRNSKSYTEKLKRKRFELRTKKKEEKYKELEERARKIGLTLRPECREIDPKVLEVAISGAEIMLNRYGEYIVDRYKSLGVERKEAEEGEEKSKVTYAFAKPSFHSDAGVYISDGMDTTIRELEKAYGNDVSIGLHPQGTKAKHITVHEFAHALVFSIAERNSVSEFEAISNIELTAEKIVERAANRVRMNPYKRGLSTESLAFEISSYPSSANYYYEEVIAEAFADYHANRSMSKQLSFAIVQEVNSELGIGG